VEIGREGFGGLQPTIIAVAFSHDLGKNPGRATDVARQFNRDQGRLVSNASGAGSASAEIGQTGGRAYVLTGTPKANGEFCLLSATRPDPL
jgi:hypothetical protein